MPNSDFFDGVNAFFVRHGCTDLRIRLPKTHAGADVVVTTPQASDALAQELASEPMVAQVAYVPKISGLNLLLDDAWLWAAITDWQNESAASSHTAIEENEEAHWSNPFYAVRYAHYRSGCVARDRSQPKAG